MSLSWLVCRWRLVRSRSASAVVLTAPPTRRYISPTRTANDHDMYEWLLAVIMATTGGMHARSAAELNSESAELSSQASELSSRDSELSSEASELSAEGELKSEASELGFEGHASQRYLGLPPFCTVI